MDITSKTVTTRLHTATVTLDGMKAVAIAAAKNKLGLVGEAAALALYADATVGPDGSIVVSILEDVDAKSDVGAASDQTDRRATAPITPSPAGQATASSPGASISTAPTAGFASGFRAPQTA